MAMLFGGRLIAAIKPWVFDHFLQRGADAVLYIDGDFVVYDGLDALGESAKESAVVVVPHIIRPMPRDGRMPDDSLVLGVGTFNAGLFCVGEGRNDFLVFLKERLRRECRIDMKAMRVNEQRWLDFVPALFEHHVARDPGLDVAPWNIHERPLSKQGERIFAAGLPLRAFHFSGFDPRVPLVLGARDYSKSPRVEVEAEPVLNEIVGQYRSWLLDAGFESFRGTPFAFDFLPDGRPIPASLRVLYAEALKLAERSGSAGPPDPFDAEVADDFRAWYVAAYGSAGRRLPFVLQAEYDGRSSTLVAVDGTMTLGNVGRRGAGGVIEVLPASVGFVGFCPRLPLEAGHYGFVIDAWPLNQEAADPGTSEMDLGLVLDLSIDGHVFACVEAGRGEDGLFRFEVSVPASLESSALSAGVDARLFSHGGIPASIDAVLMEKLDGGDSEGRRVNWILEMPRGHGCFRKGGTIRQERGQCGFIAVGPHWRLWSGLYRARIDIRAEELPKDPAATVCFVETLANGRPLVHKQVTSKDLAERTICLDFEVRGDARSANVEFRFRSDDSAAVEIGPLLVTQLGPSTDSAEPLTDWLPAMSLSEMGGRIGGELYSAPGRAGVMALGPHWRLPSGRYSVHSEVVAEATSSPVGGTVAGQVEVLVNGFVAAAQVVETGRRGPAQYGMEFDVAGRYEDADVELRITTTGVVPLRIRSLHVVSTPSRESGAA
jgi:hypothetical protein